jgi:hypothetical protein
MFHLTSRLVYYDITKIFFPDEFTSRNWHLDIKRPKQRYLGLVPRTQAGSNFRIESLQRIQQFDYPASAHGTKHIRRCAGFNETQFEC